MASINGITFQTQNHDGRIILDGHEIGYITTNRDTDLCEFYITDSEYQAEFDKRIKDIEESYPSDYWEESCGMTGVFEVMYELNSIESKTKYAFKIAEETNPNKNVVAFLYYCGFSFVRPYYYEGDYDKEKILKEAMIYDNALRSAKENADEMNIWDDDMQTLVPTIYPDSWFVCVDLFSKDYDFNFIVDKDHPAPGYMYYELDPTTLPDARDLYLK